MWPDAVAGDKGYTASDLRNWLQAHDIAAVIPYREDGDHTYDREAYRERTINRHKRYRRVARRYDKLVNSYLATIMVACMLEWR